MAKNRNKKIRKEGKNTSRPTAKKHFKKRDNNRSTDVYPASLPVVNSAENRALAPIFDASGAATKKKEELSGFIFMCSGKTKPECYVNRVFGLPAGRREVVEKIKPGMKLFLFDFDVKLLYGVYEASSGGQMNLAPAAFGGRFPAQVKFNIYKDCIPLPLSSFRTAIKENYQGSKFAPELNDQQVRSLLSLFSPIVSTSSASLHPLVPNAAPGPWMAPPPSNGWLNPSLNPPLPNPHGPYPAQPMLNPPLPLPNPCGPYSAQPMLNPQPVQQNVINPYLHQAPPPPGNPYQFAETQQPYFSNDLPQTMQEPPYPRYTPMPEVYPRDQAGGYNRLIPQTGREPGLNHIDDSYRVHNSYPMMPISGYGSPHLQTTAPYGGPSPPARGPQVMEGMRVSSYYSFDGAMRH